MRTGGEESGTGRPLRWGPRHAATFGSPRRFNCRSRARARSRLMSTVESTQSVTPASVRATAPPKVSVVIPCLNEAENIEACVRRAVAVLAEHHIPGEVIVADNASEDGSPELPAAAGARVVPDPPAAAGPGVVHEPRRGYGSAYLAGFEAAQGDYIVMADADMTYDWNEIPRLVEHLDAGGELLTGDRVDKPPPGEMR